MHCRLPEVQKARTLALQDNTEAPPSFSGRPYVQQAQPGSGSAHFVAECFFLTQRVIHTGLMPAGLPHLLWIIVARYADLVCYGAFTLPDTCCLDLVAEVYLASYAASSLL